MPMGSSGWRFHRTSVSHRARVWRARHRVRRGLPMQQAPQYDRRPPSCRAVLTRAQSHEPAVHPLRRLLCQLPCLVLLGRDGYAPGGHRARRSHRSPDLSPRRHARNRAAQAALRRPRGRDRRVGGLPDLRAAPVALSRVRGGRSALQSGASPTRLAAARQGRTGLNASRRSRHRDPCHASCAYACKGAFAMPVSRRMLRTHARLSGAGPNPGEDRMNCLSAHADVHAGAQPCTTTVASHRQRANTARGVGVRSVSPSMERTLSAAPAAFFFAALSPQNPSHIQRLAASGCGTATRGPSFALDRSELWHHCGNQTRIGTVLVRPGICAEGLMGSLRFLCSTARC